MTGQHDGQGRAEVHVDRGEVRRARGCVKVGVYENMKFDLDERKTGSP